MSRTRLLTLLSIAIVGCASKPKNDPKAGPPPSLTAPEVRRIWVPERIEGNKYFEGHYMYVIDKTSVWSR